MANNTQNSGQQSSSGNGKKAKNDKKKDSIRVIHVKTEKHNKSFSLSFQAILDGKNDKPLKNRSYEVYFEGIVVHRGKSNDDGMDFFELGFIDPGEKIQIFSRMKNAKADTTTNVELADAKKIRTLSAPNIMSVSVAEADFSFKNEMKVPVTVEFDSENFAEDDFKVVFKDSNHKILHNSKANNRGVNKYTLKISFDDVLDAIRYEGGMKKIVIEISAKTGKANKSKIEKSQKEIGINVSLPAGTLRKGFLTLFIRRKKHLIYLLKTTALLFIAYWLIGVAGHGTMDIMIAILGLYAIFVWWKKHKTKPRTVIASLMFCMGIFACILNTGSFSDPLLNGVTLAYLVGIPLYIAEEVIRKPDGSSVMNLYPWWGVIGGLVFMVYYCINIIGSFFVVLKRDMDPLTLTEVIGGTYADRLPLANFLPQIFKDVINYATPDIEKLIAIVFMIMALLMLGGTKDVFEWIKSKKFNLDASSVGDAGGGLYLLSNAWEIVRDLIPFHKKVGK